MLLAGSRVGSPLVAHATLAACSPPTVGKRADLPMMS
jgi:hypothetical protein